MSTIIACIRFLSPGLLNLTDFRSYRPGFDHNAQYENIFSCETLIVHEK